MIAYVRAWHSPCIYRQVISHHCTPPIVTCSHVAAQVYRHLVDCKKSPTKTIHACQSRPLHKRNCQAAGRPQSPEIGRPAWGKQLCTYTQTFLTAIIPKTWTEAMRVESLSWMMRCPCGFARSFWDGGDVRWKARGSPQFRQWIAVHMLLRCGLVRAIGGRSSGGCMQDRHLTMSEAT